MSEKHKIRTQLVSKARSAIQRSKGLTTTVALQAGSQLYLKKKVSQLMMILVIMKVIRQYKFVGQSS